MVPARGASGVTWFAVFAGGALGSLLRTWLWAPGAAWATGSLVANAVACFAIGVLHSRRETLRGNAVAFGAIGFCGGLSTFSAFAADLGELVGDGRWTVAAAAAGLEILVGFAAVLLGERTGRPRTRGTR